MNIMQLLDIRAEILMYGKIWLPDLINNLTKDYNVSERKANSIVNHFINIGSIILDSDRQIELKDKIVINLEIEKLSDSPKKLKEGWGINKEKDYKK